MMTMTTPPRPTLSLAELAEALGDVCSGVVGDGAVRIDDVFLDSRRITSGALFAAKVGSALDGARFARDAVDRGAVAVMAAEGASLPALGVPVVRVSDVDRGVGLAAQAVWREPSKSLGVVGITGTNGKTTTAWLVSAALEEIGVSAARLGTLGYHHRESVDEDTLTTPGADDVARYLARARDGGARAFVMEVSSHALSQRRVDAVSFAVGLFTNLTQDHLDYHGSMEAYGEAKARLFEELTPKAAVIFADDPFGAALLTRARSDRILSVSRDTRADLHPVDVTIDRQGIRGMVMTPDGEVRLSSPLVGRHNLFNLLLALGAGVALGHDAARFAEALSRLPGVPGRLERCDGAGDDIVVLVDYAHTPDALERVLVAARPFTAGTLVCVFGCGGDRDPRKRPLMGRAVGHAADRAVVTNDNPRTERPDAIAEAIEAGLRPTDTPHVIELDRRKAIEQAVVDARPGDVIVIAGKGHEPYQIVGTERRAFDDRLEARRALAIRRGEAG